MTKTQTLGDKVFDQLLERIHYGEFAPGHPLKENILAQQFGTSRGPVREAIRRLQGIQLVSRESFLKARVAKITPKTIDELFQMREALEGYACRLAASRMTKGEIDSVKAEMQSYEIEPNQDTPIEIPDFHYQIVKASRNNRIIETLCGDLYRLLHIYRNWAGNALGRRSQANKEHWEIIRAIELRDPDLSESLMRSHISRAREILGFRQV